MREASMRPKHRRGLGENRLFRTHSARWRSVSRLSDISPAERGAFYFEVHPGMASGRQSKKPPAEISRYALVNKMARSISRTGINGAGGDQSWIDLFGALDSPVHGVTSISLSVGVDEPSDRSSTGIHYCR
jgi:hypothetical protein